MSQNMINIVGKHDLINVKNFENIDQFNDFYKLHEEEINKLSTVKLNKMYHIKNFKIVRRKIEGKEDKKLCFQQIYKADSPKGQPTKLDSTNDSIDSRLTELEQTITELSNKMKAMELENTKIIKQITEIINVINSN